MSVSLKTNITMSGTQDEVIAMLKVLQTYVNENADQYKRTHDCCYLDWARIQEGRKEVSIRKMSVEEMKAYLEKHGTSLTLNASGPLGAFSELTEVTMFEEIASAAPYASFEGHSEGCITPDIMSCTGILKDGKLALSAFCQSEMQWQYGVQNDHQHGIFDPVNKTYIVD